MAGGNPTAWRGALPRQATRGAGHGRGPSSQGGGSPPGPCRRPGWWMGRLSGQRQQLGHGCMQPDPVALGGRGHEQRSVQALVVGAHLQCLPNHPLGLVPTSEPYERVGTAECRAHHQCLDLRLGAVEDGPVGASQPGEERAPDQAHGPEELLRVIGRRERREPLDVGRDRVPQPQVDATGKMRPAGRVAAQRPAGVRGRRMRGGQRHRPLGPDGQRPFGVTDAIAVEGEVDHELARGRPVERSGRAADDDRTEDRDFDAVVGHDGERSATHGDVFHAPGPGLSSWGRRDSNPHWGRFKRPASACWATPPGHHS